MKVLVKTTLSLVVADILSNEVSAALVSIMKALDEHKLKLLVVETVVKIVPVVEVEEVPFSAKILAWVGEKL